jgi:hypothetical protein
MHDREIVCPKMVCACQRVVFVREYYYMGQEKTLPESVPIMTEGTPVGNCCVKDLCQERLPA